MAAQPVEWVLVVYYGTAAHQPIYGRKVGEGGYSKDYIQLPPRPDFLKEVKTTFRVQSGTDSLPLTFKWPAESAPGEFFFKSSDRPHLAWKTRLGAPQVWKMSLAPSESTAETIPGDPNHRDFDAAENELAMLGSRGAGQPYLFAIKLRDEPNTLHLRVYLKNPDEKFAWADLSLVPEEVQALAAKTSRSRASKSLPFQSGGVAPGAKVQDALSQLIASSNPASVIDALDADTGRALASYLRQPGYGLFFDPARNHDGWRKPEPLSEQVAASADEFVRAIDARFPPSPDEDAAAESLEVDPDEVEVFRDQIEHRSFEVPDSTATVKTRGSAQKAFAQAVKTNYGFRCAITGIETREFLVAAHIVPWSKDQSIRLDPSNGICLSLLVDRAFEKGYLLIEDDHTIRIDRERLGDDHALRNWLEPYEGQTLNVSAEGGPKPEYLQRRRALVVPTE